MQFNEWEIMRDEGCGFDFGFGFGFGFGLDRWVDEAFGRGCIAGTRCVLFVPFVGGGTAQIVDGLNWWLVGGGGRTMNKQTNEQTNRRIKQEGSLIEAS